MSTHRLRIDRWQPAPLNQLMGHWATAHRLKRVDRAMVAHYCREAKVPLAPGPREVRLVITLAKGQRGCDPDAYWKSTLDALVHAGMLIDDNRLHVRMGSIDFERGSERSTLIVLEDL